MLATEAITGIAFFASLFGILYVALSARHRERMAMIEKGVEAGSLMSYTGLRLGFLGLGLAAGLLVGAIGDAIMKSMGRTDENPLPFFIGILACGGLALIIAHKRVAEARKQLDPSTTSRS